MKTAFKQKISSEDFLDKFAIDDASGAFVLKADACCRRFDIARPAVDMTKGEDWAATGYFGRAAYSNEMKLINRVHSLMKDRGIDRLPDIPLEDFVLQADPLS